MDETKYIYNLLKLFFNLVMDVIIKSAEIVLVLIQLAEAEQCVLNETKIYLIKLKT